MPTTRRCTFVYKLILLLWKNIKIKIRSPVSILVALYALRPLLSHIFLANSRRIDMAVASVRNITDIKKEIRTNFGTRL